METPYVWWNINKEALQLIWSSSITIILIATNRQVMILGWGLLLLYRSNCFWTEEIRWLSTGGYFPNMAATRDSLFFSFSSATLATQLLQLIVWVSTSIAVARVAAELLQLTVGVVCSCWCICNFERYSDVYYHCMLLYPHWRPFYLLAICINCV